MLLQGARVRLIPPDRRHIDDLLRWMNDPEIWSFIRRDRPLGRVEEEEWFAGLHKRPGDVPFIIGLSDGGQAIGSCGFHGLGSPNGSAELGIAIGEREYWSRGFGLEAMELLCEYGFQVQNLHRIGLSVFDYNVRGVRCYEKAGFRLEGRRREARFWEGRYHDILEMGLLASEWRERREVADEGCRVRALRA